MLPQIIRPLLSGLLSLTLVSLLSGVSLLPGQSSPPRPQLTLPLNPGSVRFAVIGDNGTGGKEQYEVAQQMERYREYSKFNFVIMLGDNIYGSDAPADMKKKFEDPYKSLLDAGVKFYASLGNHDNPNERFYKLFNMGEKRYYTLQRDNVRLFALDSTSMNPEQLAWLDKELQSSGSDWKICFMHHPLYSDGRFHGSDLTLRERLQPLLDARGVNVVFSGHDHVYERVTPKDGVAYFVMGSSGQLRSHGLRQTSDVAKGFDTDRGFMIVEVSGDRLFFQTVSRTGETVDSGGIDRIIEKPAP